MSDLLESILQEHLDTDIAPGGIAEQVAIVCESDEHGASVDYKGYTHKLIPVGIIVRDSGRHCGFGRDSVR